MSDDNNTDDDKALFQKEMAHVKPIKPSGKVPHKPKQKVAKKSKKHTSDKLAYEVYDSFSDAPIEDCPEHLSYSKSGLQHSLLKKLRLGKMPIESHLDLHGMTVNEARQALLYFIAECEDLQCRCVIVVHGKGYSSPNNKPVIKAYVNRWLRESAPILAFCSAQAADGGTGAAYVLLKTSATYTESDEL